MIFSTLPHGCRGGFNRGVATLWENCSLVKSIIITDSPSLLVEWSLESCSQRISRHAIWLPLSFRRCRVCNSPSLLEESLWLWLLVWAIKPTLRVRRSGSFTASIEAVYRLLSGYLSCFWCLHRRYSTLHLEGFLVASGWTFIYCAWFGQSPTSDEIQTHCFWHRSCLYSNISPWLSNHLYRPL